MNTKFLKSANENKTEFELFRTKIFPVSMYWEGGGKLHNVKGDNGGWTIWGIAYNFNKQHFSSFEDFKNTTEEEAAAFAFSEYYLPLKPKFLPCDCKLYAFDIAYNMGVSRAKKYIQRCAGVTADGVFGKQTINNMPKITLECLHSLRVSYYNNLGKNAQYAKFLKGWLSRANDVYKKSK